jgi:energy-coupling factor transporter ATP-binding protein EcfA2
MNFSGRPLLSTRLDGPLYLRRPVHDQLVKTAERGMNVLVLGQRGSGKSSLLHHVAAELRAKGHLVTELDGRLAEAPVDFLRLVQSQMSPRGMNDMLADSISSISRGTNELRSALGGDPLASVTECLRVIHQIGRDLDSVRRIVLCDEPTPEIAHTVFGRLRDELWQLPITWVVTGNDTDESSYLTPPADAFFERVMRIPKLSENEQRHLVTLRAEDPEQERHLAGISGDTPRSVIANALASLENGLNAKEVSEEARSIEEAANRLGRPAAMAFAELRSIGPSSASDKQFLKRLGWTRERASQVLRQLEEAGVVESFLERGEQGGRPRKVYRVRSVA